MSKNDHAFKSTSSIRKVKIKLKIEACFTHIYHILTFLSWPQSSGIIDYDDHKTNLQDLSKK